MPNDDIADMLRSIGVRVSREALLALTAHATTARLSPTQTFEELVALARCQRDQRNLAARTKAAKRSPTRSDSTIRLAISGSTASSSRRAENSPPC